MSQLTGQELERLCDAARSAARSAGQYIQSRFNQHYEKKYKVGGDSLASQVVTEVDFKAQGIILEHLEDSMDRYGLGLLTEESTDDQSRLEKDYFWCIDPMDGTLPFTEQRTGYAVSIALISKAGDPVIGVVFIPDLNTCYAAVKGAGVSVNDEPLVRERTADETIHFYMDKSFQSEPYYENVKVGFDQHFAAPVEIHSSFGGVRNAIGVMSAGRGCYFKFTKESKGCGSIWDYAATRLFFEELGLPVMNARGETLHLNDPETTFMNDQGILYATDNELKEFIISLER